MFVLHSQRQRNSRYKPPPLCQFLKIHIIFLLSRHFWQKPGIQGRTSWVNQEAPEIQNQQPKTKPGSSKISQERNRNRNSYLDFSFVCSLEKREEEKEKEICGFGKLPDTYQGDVMRVKWTTGNDQVMRQLVDENEAEPEATKIRIH